MDHICQLKLHKLKLNMTISKKQRNFKKPTLVAALDTVSLTRFIMVPGVLQTLQKL